MANTWQIIVGFGYLVMINSLTFYIFALDKQRAIDRGWRVKEDTLLLLAFLGGSVAAKRAQLGLRHKTRKQPFAATLNVILTAHIVIIGYVLYPIVRVWVYYALGYPLDGLAGG